LIRDKRLNPKYFVEIVKDISERKEAERIIETQRLRMLSGLKMCQLGETAAKIAHEINNPFALISGRAELLLESAVEGGVTREPLIQAAEKIGSTCVRIGKIVKSLRDFSRDSARDPFEVTTIDMILGCVLELRRGQYESDGIELRVDSSSLIAHRSCGV
jgi:signal transduction histidine kinase